MFSIVSELSKFYELVIRFYYLDTVVKREIFYG